MADEVVPARVESTTAGLGQGMYMGCGTEVCGEHRTVGYRAWCSTCQEWCYPSAFCARGELAQYRNLYGDLDDSDLLPGGGE